MVFISGLLLFTRLDDFFGTLGCFCGLRFRIGDVFVCLLLATSGLPVEQALIFEFRC
jgi:hypothetical protein